jgi:protein disulfide-isomerase-like protein
MDYNTKYLKYKEKYLVLQKEYNELIAKKNMKGGNGNGNQISGMVLTAEKKLPDNTKITLILFKADWCGHCKTFKPTWDKISEIYNKKFNFVTYDADKQTDKFKEYKVNAFPTVLVKNGNNLMSYEGDRSFDDLNNFIQSIN